ncbi:16964_t:CDS:2, partial [Acaulospora colombiana]
MGNCHSDTTVNTEDEGMVVPPSPVSTASHRFFNARSMQIAHETSKSSFESHNVSETKRLQSQYSYMSNLWESKKFHSPLDQKLRGGGMKVLDIGCGTGEWILDMAKEYPNTRFYGLDMLPIYPTSSLPENVKFHQANLLEGLPFEDETFDFVNMSLLVRHLTTRQWEDVVVRELVRVTKPLGFIELMEGDLSLHNQGPITAKLQEASRVDACQRYQSNDRDDHLQDTYDKSSIAWLECRNANWLLEQSLETGLQVFKMLKKPNLEFMSVTSSEYDDMLTSYVQEVEEYNTYCRFYRFYVQKIDVSPSPMTSTDDHNHFTEIARSSSTYSRNASKNSNAITLTRSYSTNTNNNFSYSSQTPR